MWHSTLAEGGPPQLARLTPNVIGTAQYAAPELMNEDLLEDMKPEQRYLQVSSLCPAEPVSARPPTWI